MKAITTIFIFVALLFSTQLFSQQRPVKVDSLIVESIEKEVWIPFMESYRDLDFQKLESIHTKDITKVSPKMNQIQTGATYLKTLNAFFEQIKSLNYQMDIRLSIVSSATSEEKVYQTGYYTIGLRKDDQSAYQSTGYSTFSILAEKDQAGRWKIAFDTDEPTKMTEEEFMKSGIIYTLN